MRRLLFSVLCVLAVTAFASRASAQIAKWTFETSLPFGTDQTNNGPWSAEQGSNAGAGSPASGVHALAASDWSNPSGNGSAESYSVNTWSPNDYFQFSTSTTGFSSITFAWSQARSSTGPDDFVLEWSLDNTVYTVLSTYVVLFNDASNGGAWNGTTHISNYDFGPIAAPAALNNQPIVYFRIRDTEAAASAAAGTCRVDDVTIAPEPASMALMLIGGLVALRRRR